jgi:hypothetical protein
MANDNKTANGIGLGTLIFLVFLTLKLAGIGEVAKWSWWWVTSPLWLPVLIILGIVFFILMIKALF